MCPREASPFPQAFHKPQATSHTLLPPPSAHYPPPMPLTELLDYFSPFASDIWQEEGVTRLFTPQVNVLGLNAAYVSGPEQLALLHFPAGQPPLVASAFGVTSFAVSGQEVARLQVGLLQAAALTAPAGVVVEQVSRLQLPNWAGVLAAAHGTPDWGGLLARHFAAPLEHDRRSVLLMAYAEGVPMGALLWRGGSVGGAAHLWGSQNSSAAQALLRAAAELGGGWVRASVPDASDWPLAQAWTLRFTLLGGAT